MKKLIIITSFSVFIMNGCVDSETAVYDTESVLLALLDEDEAVGVDGFDSGGDMDLDLSVRYFFGGYFADLNLDGFSTEGMVFGLGKMFTFHKSCYVAPDFNYAYDAETFNLGLGFGLKF